MQMLHYPQVDNLTDKQILMLYGGMQKELPLQVDFTLAIPGHNR